MFIVFDMDGTLSDPSHRLHFLQGEKKDWDSFYEACDGDAPIVEMLSIFDELAKNPYNRIEIWTGRRESVRLKSVAWLHGALSRGSSTQFVVRMRKDGDKRHDVEVKGEWLNFYGRPDLIFEDRNSMVNSWRSKDIRCLQVAPGDF